MIINFYKNTKVFLFDIRLYGSIVFPFFISYLHTMKKHVLLLSILILLLWQVAAQAQIITTVAGGGTNNPGDGGQAIDCELNSPTGVAVDAAGNFYICERDAHRVRKVTPDGTITTIAGTGVAGYSGDGGMATAAKVFAPYGIVLDETGNIYFSETGNHVVRKINVLGFISTIAGTGVGGYNGDNIPASSAQLAGPGGIAVDRDGNVYVADSHNYRIRKIILSGSITTIAGIDIGGFSGDGGFATNAKLNLPHGVACDDEGNLYIADMDNNRVRRVDATGIITTIAGDGYSGYSGDNVAATSVKLNRPHSVVKDLGGNVYISDASNHLVRKVNALGIISTIAGEALIPGDSGDGGPATAARLRSPTGITISSGGNLYIANFSSDKIRKISNVVSVLPQPAAVKQPNMDIYPNPNSGTFSIQVSTGLDEHVTITITDVLGRTIGRFVIVSKNPSLLRIDAPNGMYVVRANTDMWTISEKVSIQH